MHPFFVDPAFTSSPCSVVSVLAQLAFFWGVIASVLFIAFFPKLKML